MRHRSLLPFVLLLGLPALAVGQSLDLTIKDYGVSIGDSRLVVEIQSTG